MPSRPAMSVSAEGLAVNVTADGVEKRGPYESAANVIEPMDMFTAKRGKR